MLSLAEARSRAAAVRAAFFDVDGTLLSLDTHELPDSALRALHALRDAGIELYLSSGRPPCQIEPVFSGVFDFDGVVGISGQYCYDAAGPYHTCALDPADVNALVDAAKAGHFDLVVENIDGAYCDDPKPEGVRRIEELLDLWYQPRDLDLFRDEPVYQLCAALDPSEDWRIRHAAHHVQVTRWSPVFVDIMPAGGGKDVGMRATLARHGYTAEQAIAFGDGENDETMLAAAGLGVAMGNADAKALAVADYVTDGVLADGIWNACVALGLIGDTSATLSL